MSSTSLSAWQSKRQELETIIVAASPSYFEAIWETS